MSQPSRRGLNSSPATLEDARLRNLPPQNLDAEQAVLGGVLLKMSLLDRRVRLFWPIGRWGQTGLAVGKAPPRRRLSGCCI
jgi:hypothetical protein